MPTIDPRIDAYIENAAPFARPILLHLRGVVHGASPEIEETIKWGFPHFVQGGGIVCSMAAFKAHCAFGFWQGAAIVEPGDRAGEKAMGQFGRIASLDDLPPDEVIAGYVRKAVELRASGATKGATKGAAKGATPRAAKPELPVPEAVTAALATNDAARAHFERFSPSARREYVEWITEAKTDATRDRRLAQMLEWVAEGKPRNWKYMKG